MTCETALIKDVICLNASITLGQATSLLNQHNIRSAPVIDDKGTYLGLFSFHSLFTSLLPVAVTMEGGLDQLDFVGGSAPGIAKRLGKNSGINILKHLDLDKPTVQETTPLWEGIRILVKHGSPIAVVDKEGRFIGLITEQSCLSALEKIQKEASSRPEGELSQDDIQVLKKSGII